MKDEARFLPDGVGPKPIETPFGTRGGQTRLQDLLEGKQVARLEFSLEPGPTGSPVLLLELTTGERFLIMAGRSRVGHYSARLFFRAMPAQRIWTPDMSRRARGRNPLLPEDRYDDDPRYADLQRCVEGEVIRGHVPLHEPTPGGGEQCLLEFAGRKFLHLAAAAILKLLPDGQAYLADLRWQWAERTPLPARRSLSGLPDLPPSFGLGMESA